MMHPVKVNSILGLAVMMSLLTFAPEPSFASCKNSGGSSGSSRIGSQVNGGSVTICASALAITPARSSTVNSTVKLVSKVAAKPAAKPTLKTPLKAVIKPKLAFHRVPVAVTKPKPVIKSKPIIKSKTLARVVSKPSTANKTSAAADFTPAAVTGSVYPANQLSIGQQAAFVTSAVQHYRTGTLLNLPTEVRFTPLTVAWSFGDGSSASGGYVGHAFDSVGSHAVQVRVVYAVSYRVRGSMAWIAEPDTITVADELLVEVAAGSSTGNQADPPQSALGKVLLVGADCLSNPGTFGCN